MRRDDDGRAVESEEECGSSFALVAPTVVRSGGDEAAVIAFDSQDGPSLDYLRHIRLVLLRAKKYTPHMVCKPSMMLWIAIVLVTLLATIKFLIPFMIRRAVTGAAKRMVRRVVRGARRRVVDAVEEEARALRSA